jgi:acetone carboxylase gamma subunit
LQVYLKEAIGKWNTRTYYWIGEVSSAVRKQMHIQCGTSFMAPEKDRKIRAYVRTDKTQKEIKSERERKSDV